MKLYKTSKGILVESKGMFYLISEHWDTLINHNDLHSYLEELSAAAHQLQIEEAEEWVLNYLLPPVGQQEVWAAGVTYLRSRDARIEESLASGGADLYDRVYDAERPELFFKSLPHRVCGHNQTVYIRRDSSWNVPEPECTLFINSDGHIQGYTIGNDMSSRSIEGENALYLPQAKVYQNSAALGPCLYVPAYPLTLSTEILMMITRMGQQRFSDRTTLSQMKRSFTELAEFLYRECDFIHGAFLMTGTCLVPDNGFILQENDRVDITISEIGTLTNMIGYKPVRSSQKIEEKSKLNQL